MSRGAYLSGRYIAVIMAIGAVMGSWLATTGCNADPEPVAIPTTTAPAAPDASTSSEDEAVKKAYTQYWVVLPQAEHTTSEDRRRELLSRYTTEPQLGTALDGINKLHQQDLTSAGRVVVNIRRVDVNGDTATVWDCQDATQALIKNTKTGKAVSRGMPNDHLRATLKRGADGQWRISTFAQLGRC